MADPGILNPSFEPDDTSESDTTLRYGPLEPNHKWREPSVSGSRKGPVAAVEMQKIQRMNKRHRKSASVGTPIQWIKEDSTPAKVLRAWKDAQIRLDMASSSDSDDDKTPWKSRGTQTEEPYATLSSWKILRTRPRSEYKGDFENTQPESTPKSLDPDLMVVETRSLGFEASTQTRDAFLFRYTDAEAFEMIMAWRMLTIFLPITWYMIMYVADQVTDVVVTIGFCNDHDWWWCGLSLTFLIIPHFAINAYAYEQLVRPDIASVAPVNKWFARALLATQIAPHYLMGRKWSWCFRAWRKVSWRQRRRKRRRKEESSPSAVVAPDPESQKPQKLSKSAKILWEQASAETYSETVKLYQSLLVSTPQLGIQTYVLMVEWQGYENHSYVEPILILSVFISLTSASAGLASVLADNAWEKIAASTAIFLTLGSRVLVLGAVGTMSSGFWFIPVGSAVFVGVITKICESKETTPLPILVKMHKYFSEAIVMATVCPPFNALGIFTSIPYVLAGLVFLLREPGGATNIITFIFSIFGQVAWLAVGFFVT